MYIGDPLRLMPIIIERSVPSLLTKDESVGTLSSESFVWSQSLLSTLVCVSTVDLVRALVSQLKLTVKSM